MLRCGGPPASDINSQHHQTRSGSSLDKFWISPLDIASPGCTIAPQGAHQCRVHRQLGSHEWQPIHCPTPGICIRNRKLTLRTNFLVCDAFRHNGNGIRHRRQTTALDASDAAEGLTHWWNMGALCEEAQEKPDTDSSAPLPSPQKCSIFIEKIFQQQPLETKLLGHTRRRAPRQAYDRIPGANDRVTPVPCPPSPHAPTTRQRSSGRGRRAIPLLSFTRRRDETEHGRTNTFLLFVYAYLTWQFGTTSFTAKVFHHDERFCNGLLHTSEFVLVFCLHQTFLDEKNNAASSSREWFHGDSR